MTMQGAARFWHDRKAGEGQRKAVREEGAALVEMAVACAVFLMMLFGLIEMCLALYTYNFVSDAARVATRYAVVRGATSCTDATVLNNFPDCNLSTSAPLQNLVRNLNYPGMNPNNLTLTATWLSPTLDSSLHTTWGPCTGVCNNAGDAVNVVVTYQFPLNIPFWQNATLNVGSSSQMVINE